jgi:TPR repeat protein
LESSLWLQYSQQRLFTMQTLLKTIALAGVMLLPAYGAEERELKDESGKTVIRYVADVPEGMAKEVGLFLCFPEHDRPTGDEIYPVRAALERLGLRDQYVVIAGHPQGQKFGPMDHEPIQKLLAWALKTYPVNPRRVYMYGKGEGGKISGEMAMAYPHLVTAAISYSWTWWKMPSHVDKPVDPERGPQFYMVLGRRDLAHHLTNVRDGYSRVQAKGFRVIYREFDELGARTYHPPSNDEAIRWAHGLRNRTLPLSKAEQAAADKGGLKELAAIGYAPGIEKHLTAKEAATRAAAARVCAQVNLGEATMAVLAKLATDASAMVRREAIRALAVNANWRSQTAQEALIRLAESGVEQADRVAAVDGLVNAVRFQVRGVRQDPAVFRALAGLLTSKDDELRTMASNALAPIRDGEFRGDIGRPEKKAPEGGWTAWLDAITAKNAGYTAGYANCGTAAGEAAALFCKGGPLLKTQPAEGFALTLRAAEMGYVPAQAMAGMLYATENGTGQNFAEAAKWWVKAAEGGHGLAATNASMLFRGSGVRGDAALAAKLTEQAAEYARATATP